MFEQISGAMQTRMEYLEKIDQKDRIDGTERVKRLRQIPPETWHKCGLFSNVDFPCLHRTE